MNKSTDFSTLELDRGNIANAITDNFLEDVGIDQDQFNVGQQMLSLGIVLCKQPLKLFYTPLRPCAPYEVMAKVAVKILVAAA